MRPGAGIQQVEEGQGAMVQEMKVGEHMKGKVQKVVKKVELQTSKKIDFHYEKIIFWINGVADRNPLFCAECCFGMQFCFWHAALLHCTIVHYPVTA